MRELPDTVPFVVRPSLRVALVQIVLLEALIVLALGTSALCAKWLSMERPPEPIWGMVFVFGWPLLMFGPHLGSRSRSWVVGPHGIDTQRDGKLHQTIAWSDVVAVEVLPGMGAIVRHTGSRKIGEQLACLTLQDTRRLACLWRQIRAPAPPKEIPPTHLFRVTLSSGLLSLACLPLFLACWRIAPVRAVCGTAGNVGALFGTGVALWAAFRLRSLRLLLSGVPAALALFGWIWMVAHHFHRLAQ